MVDASRTVSGDGPSLAARLEMAYGSAAPAVLALERALALAGRTELPDSPPELVAFVHTRLVPILVAEIGAHLTMALVDDLVGDLAPASSTQPVDAQAVDSVPQPVARVSLRTRSSPPAKMELSVLLVEVDRVWRSMLARGLVRVRWGVSVVDSVDELREVVRPGEPIDVAIVDVLHPDAGPIIDGVVAAFPTVVVLARAASHAKAYALLEERGVHRFDVRSREAPAEELIDAVRRILES
jgi:hypothetical protein